MNATAKLTNMTGVRKNLSQLGVAIEPGESAQIDVADAMRFVNRAGWIVHIPPEACEFRRAGQISLYFTAPISVTDGYGNHAEGILLGLDRAGIKVTARHLWQLNPTGLQKRTLDLLQQPIATMHAVGLCMATPGEFGRLPTPFKIGLTQYESSDYRPHHPEWTRQINEIDLLLTFGVGDDWNVQMFRRCGVRIPISTVRGSGNWHFYRVENRWHPHDRDEFVVVTWGMMHKRKSALEMVDVFKRAFPRNRYPDCRFRIKTINGVIGDLPPGSYHPDDQRIEIISADWTPAQLIEFAKGGDVMLYLARGEGCGRPPREAMAMGLPLICANNTGMQPICDDRYMNPIETKRWAPSPIGGEWAEPNWDQAVEALRWHYEHREKACRKAANGAEWILRHHSPAIQAMDIMLAFDQIDPARAKSVRGNRDWVQAYLPEMNHTPAVKALRQVCEPPARIAAVGPQTLHVALERAGYETVGLDGLQGNLEATINRLRVALGESPIVVLGAPSHYYPVSIGEFILGFHEWERLLEKENFNVVGRVAYGGDHQQDYSVFILSASPKVRGVLIR
jgi:glycosyltransferase involved in cell wall biosynthesis